MPASDYITMMSNPKTLGNPLVATQHFFGISTWQRTSESEITATYQLRAHHVRLSSDGQGDVDGYGKGRGRRVLTTATGHGVIQHFYRKSEKGEWKLAGLQPTVLFEEGDVRAVFEFRESGEDAAQTA